MGNVSVSGNENISLHVLTSTHSISLFLRPLRCLAYIYPGVINYPVDISAHAR